MLPVQILNRLTGSSLIVIALCLSVAMQVLGVPTSLWTMEFQTDMVTASLLEGFSLPADFVIPGPIRLSNRRVDSSRSLWSTLLEHTLFRPPDAQL